MKNNLIRYKNYHGSVNYSNDDVLYGKLEGILDLVSYEGHRDVESLKKAFKDAVDDYLDTCKDAGREPERPFKGTLNIRVSPWSRSKLWKKASPSTNMSRKSSRKQADTGGRRHDIHGSSINEYLSPTATPNFFILTGESLSAFFMMFRKFLSADKRLTPSVACPASNQGPAGFRVIGACGGDTSE